MLCLDPSDAETSEFSKGDGEDHRLLEVSFEPCRKNNSTDIECLTKVETESWFNEHYVIIQFYQKITIVDLSSTENVVSKRMAALSFDQF